MKRIVTKIFNRICLLLISFLILADSCKFTQIPNPTTQLVTSSTFSDNNTATAALTGIYSQMISNFPFLPYDIPLYTGLSSDEFINYSTDTRLIQFYSNSLNATTNTTLYSLWSSLYNYIYQSNAIIEGVSQSTKLNEDVKKQLVGEAKFIRAFIHFYLVNLWGDVPLVISTDYRSNSVTRREKQSVVYTQIINDLNEAQNLLSDKYVDRTDTIETTDRVRPNKWCATALLARVYLYLGDWKNAEIQATNVLNNTSIYSLEDVNNVFIKNNREAIWQLMMPQPNGLSTVEGAYFILTDGPQSGGTNCSTLSLKLLNAFEPGDKRRISWVDSIKTNSTYYYPNKYREQYSSDPIEYSTVLRLAEIYLIRAEARINQRNVNGSLSDLNAIRQRAGLQNSIAITKDDILNAIYHERQVELFTEWGHRWLDLKRTGLVDTVMPNITLNKGGTWTTNWKLYPIPQVDINADINLTQNSGY